MHQHLKFTRGHRSSVRSEREFLGEVCDALDGIAEVLVTGGLEFTTLWLKSQNLEAL